MAEPPFIRLQDFCFSYGSRMIFRQLSLAVPAAGCTVLLGPSGTGKSTLLRVLAGGMNRHPLVKVEGHIELAGAVGFPVSSARLPAFVEQKARMLMTPVSENLFAALPDRAQLQRAEQLARLHAELGRWQAAELLEHLTTPVIDLPTPLQRMVSIACQALGRPSMLMVDEPTANLSPQQAEPIVNMLTALAREQPMLVVTHHQGHARALADYIILIADGRVQEAAAADDFFNRPQSEAAACFLRTGSCPEVGMSADDETTEVEGGGEDTRTDATEDPANKTAARDTAAVESDTVDAAPRPVAGVLPTALATASTPEPPVSGRTPAPSASVARGRGPRGFTWLLPGQLAGTPWPGIVADADYDLTALQDAGITRLLTLTEYPFPDTVAAPYQIRCIHAPIIDMQPPSVAQAIELCQTIDSLLAQDEAIAVHCKAGLGRTGTLLAAYWLWRARPRLSGIQAIRHIRSLNGGMIQSIVQEEFLENFARTLATDDCNHPA